MVFKSVKWTCLPYSFTHRLPLGRAYRPLCEGSAPSPILLSFCTFLCLLLFLPLCSCQLPTQRFPSSMIQSLDFIRKTPWSCLHSWGHLTLRQALREVGAFSAGPGSCGSWFNVCPALQSLKRQSTPRQWWHFPISVWSGELVSPVQTDCSRKPKVSSHHQASKNKTYFKWLVLPNS